MKHPALSVVFFGCAFGFVAACSEDSTTSAVGDAGLDASAGGGGGTADAGGSGGTSGGASGGGAGEMGGDGGTGGTAGGEGGEGGAAGGGGAPVDRNRIVPPIPDDVGLTALDCPTPTTCVVVGGVSPQDESRTFHRTADAGETWDLIALPEGFEVPPIGLSLNGIQFVDATTGFVVGQNSEPHTLWKTTDAGLTWAVVPSAGLETSEPGEAVRGLTFLDAERGFVILAKRILATVDGGLTFTPWLTAATQENPEEPAAGLTQFRNLACVDALTCVTGGVGGLFQAAFIRTTDGGGSFDMQLAGPEDSKDQVISMRARSATQLISASALSVWTSGDAGATWVAAAMPGTTPANPILTAECVPGTDHCFAGGGTRVSPSQLFFETLDGTSWSPVALPEAVHSVTAIKVADETHVYLLTDKGLAVGF